MSAHDILMGAAGNTNGTTYVDDVFSTYTYIGTSAAKAITNGIDLADKGGLVWIKNRLIAQDNLLYDNNRGIENSLKTNSTGIQASAPAGYDLTAFNSNGFSLGNDYRGTNTGSAGNNSYASWTFRKQPKFFDIVTYTGDGVFPRAIAHNLGSTPGMIIVKRLETTGDWWTYHRSLGATQWLKLNLTGAATTSTVFGTPTSSTFTVSAGATNISGGSFVAYIFAHDAGGFGAAGTDNVISCGSWTGSAEINLGYEPQFIMTKSISSVGAWKITDNMRGWVNSGNDAILFPNTSDAESSGQSGNPTATGFLPTNVGADTHIYMAIRRPNKPPTTGTQVYNAIARTGTAAAATVTGVGFAPDLVVVRENSTGGAAPPGWIDRLRGRSVELYPNATTAEYTTGATTDVTSFDINGMSVGTSDGFSINNSPNTYINWFFKRAPGFFDEVCYTGTGTNPNILTHNLGAVPELIIIKERSAVSDWLVQRGASIGGFLNTTSVLSAINVYAGSTVLSSTQLSLDSANAQVNASGQTYVAYLFATLAGVSKVGSYTGNGTSQTIACGFSAGARFILIKRTNAAGDWYVWDTVRGIVTANDPHLSLNTTAAEVTTDDSIDPASSGFIVNQLAATNINVTSATYIFLAIA